MGNLSGIDILEHLKKVTVGGYIVKKLDGNRFAEYSYPSFFAEAVITVVLFKAIACAAMSRGISRGFRPPRRT